MFTVAWSKEARDQLTAAWINANTLDRREITDSAALLEKHLRANAPRIGESRDDETLRFVSTGPLGIEFQVSELDRLVTVFKTWLIPRRTK